MPFCRTLLVLLLGASVGWGAELRTLKGQVHKGEVSSISDKEVVLTEAGTKVAVPVTQVLQLDFAEPGRLPADVKYSDVELTDGSVLHCTRVLVKGKQAELTVL